MGREGKENQFIYENPIPMTFKSVEQTAQSLAVGRVRRRSDSRVEEGGARGGREPCA